MSLLDRAREVDADPRLRLIRGDVYLQGDADTIRGLLDLGAGVERCGWAVFVRHGQPGDCLLAIVRAGDSGCAVLRDAGLPHPAVWSELPSTYTTEPCPACGRDAYPAQLCDRCRDDDQETW